MNDNRDLKHNRRIQLDRTYKFWKEQLSPRPKKGWIAEIRTLLMMTTSQLARRVGVAQSVISNFEKSERENTITLQSLKKVADALECELHYFLLPKKGLEHELYERAEKLYQQNEKRLEHHMRLEGQGSDVVEDVRRAYEILKLYDKVWDKNEA